jgi:predicted transcriptional regulator YdeE
MSGETITLIGLKLKDKTTNENAQAMVDCGNHWQKFEQEEVFNKIPGKSSQNIYAVYYDYEGDHTKPYSYFIGCAVTEATPTPEGMDRLTIPKQTYEHIIAKGAMPACVADAWRNIWNSERNRAYGYDFEIYSEKSSDWSNAEVDIYLSVKK